MCVVELPILLVDYASNIWGICATITFRSKMEWQIRVLRELVQEQLKECIYIFPSCGAIVHRGPVVGIGEAVVDWLIEEDDVGVGVPAVGVVGRVATRVGDRARP